MNIQNLQINNQTMSSREIADLCEKQHGHVKRDIETMCQQIEIDASKFGYTYIDVSNRRQFEYMLDKNLTITLVAGYNAQLRYRIVKRWQELETQTSAPVIPATLSEALRLAADQAELIEDQQSRLALAEPKAAALDIIDGASGRFNVRETAKTLCIPQNKFIDWAIAHDWLYRDNAAKLQMVSKRMKQGFMTQRSVTYRDGHGAIQATMQPLFTPKGLTHLAKTFAIVHEVA